VSKEVNRKGCSYEAALAIGIVGFIIWLSWFTPVINEYLPGAGAIVAIPFGSLLLSWFKRRTGGLLIIISSFVPLITMAAIPDMSSDPTYGLVAMLFFALVTVPLCLSGALIIINTLQKEEQSKLEGTEKGEGETFDYITNRCPYCNSPTIEGGIIYQAKTGNERRKLGFSIKRQLVCLRCKLKWIVLEK
jgi:hypothetical protein